MRKAPLLLSLAILVWAPNASAAIFDRTFGGGDGVATVHGIGSNPNTQRGYAVAVRADGKIVVLARARSTEGSLDDFALLRFNRNGTLDKTFGADNTGKVVTDMGGGSDSPTPGGLRIRADGKIVAVGSSGAPGTGLDVVVGRWTSDGVPDGTFAGDGTLRLPISAGNRADYAAGLALQAGGKVVVAYGTDDPSTGEDMGVLRLNDDGTLDGGPGSDDSVPADEFGTDGKTQVDFGDGQVEIAESMVTQPDGKLVLVGEVDTDPVAGGANEDLDFGAVRFNANGSLDSGSTPDTNTADAFGTAGRTTVGFDLFEDAADIPYAVARQPDGKLVLAGTAPTPTDNGEIAFVRLKANGAIDDDAPGAFSTDGKLTIDIDDEDYAEDVLIQPDGKIFAVGVATELGGVRNIALTRVGPAGVPDASFDGDGRFTTNLSPVAAGNDELVALTLSGAKILAAGALQPAASQEDVLLASFLHTDPDDDGVGSPGEDNCPNVPNPGQANVDGDALGNACDPSIDGGAGDDTLVGTALAELFNGRGGNDTIRALGGADTLNGGLGGDTLIAGPGADTLNGGAGPDKLKGGKGKDVFEGGKGNDVVSAADGKRETVRCGKGKGDRAVADEKDTVKGCEQVTRKP